VVRAGFYLEGIDSIGGEAETFEFTGVLTLKWKDERQAFDPDEAGVREKIYQGDYQFNELAPAWCPQVMLVNRPGLFETSATILRIAPDGSSTLRQTVDALLVGRRAQVIKLVGHLFRFGERLLRRQAQAAERDLRVPQQVFRLADLHP
jgi:hypothetical protein